MVRNKSILPSQKAKLLQQMTMTMDKIIQIKQKI